MSMLLEALKKAALEKKSRLEQKAVFTSVIDSHKPVSSKVDTLSSNANDDASNLLVDKEDTSQSVLAVESSPIDEKKDETDLSQEILAEKKEEIFEDWSNDVDFSELNSQINMEEQNENDISQAVVKAHTNAIPEDKTNENLTADSSKEDLIASIVADALSQTEDKVQDLSVDTPKTNAHTKEALSQLIEKSKKRERLQNKRLMIILVSLFVVSVTLGALYYRFLNFYDSDFINTPNAVVGLGSLSENQIDTSLPLETESQVLTETIEEIEARNHIPPEAPAAELIKIQRVSEAVEKPISPKPLAQIPKSTATTKPVQKAQREESNIIRLDPLPEAVRNAYAAYNAGNFQTALNLYQEAYSLAPDNVDVLLGLAACSLKLNQSDNALLYYRQVLRNNPNERNALAGLLSITSSQANQPDLENQLRNLLNDNPDDAHLHFLMGNVYLSQQNWNGANTEFSKAANLNMRNPDYLYNLAISFDQLGEKQKALYYYEEAYALSQISPASFSPSALSTRIRALSNQRQ